MVVKLEVVGIVLCSWGCAADMGSSELHASSVSEHAAEGRGAGGLVAAPVGHPGRGPWEQVPPDFVREACHLDPAALDEADRVLNKPWVAIRYGRLCHAFGADMRPEESFSATKILGATTAGAVAYQTRDLERTGRKTGAFSDEDRVDHWIDGFTFHKDAHVAHVLAMVAQSDDLSYGKRVMEYDYTGIVQLDSLNFMLHAAIAQDPERLGADLEAFVQRFMFGPLGMTQSTWSYGLPNKAFGFGWNTTVLDMARLGQLLLRHGMVNDTRLINEEWVYRMTHPAFEDANTAMGYCTWLNAAKGFTTGTMPTPASWTDLTSQPRFPGPCAPLAIHREHPHGLSQAPDCNYGSDRSCQQQHDVGVWQSIAGYGSVIQGHPGLDLVLVGWQLTPEDFFGLGASGKLWDAVRPAVIAEDPTFTGDETAFCREYGNNRYAPDLLSQD
jgi:hypothetical protein